MTAMLTLMLSRHSGGREDHHPEIDPIDSKGVDHGRHLAAENTPLPDTSIPEVEEESPREATSKDPDLIAREEEQGTPDPL